MLLIALRAVATRRIVMCLVAYFPLTARYLIVPALRPVGSPLPRGLSGWVPAFRPSPSRQLKYRIFVTTCQGLGTGVRHLSQNCDTNITAAYLHVPPILPGEVLPLPATEVSHMRGTVSTNRDYYQLRITKS